MNWFKKHLNLTLLFTWVVLNILVVVGVRLTNSNTTLGVAVLILAVVFMWAVEIWHIAQKGHSIWNLVWNFLPYVGIIMIFLLDNRKEIEKEREIGHKN